VPPASGGASGWGGPTADPATAARTSFPDLPAASGEPTLPSLSTVKPARGKVVQAEGPFDDRFQLDGLRFDGSEVTGTATITSDVSEILEFEALAGFYDQAGELRGTGRYVHHLEGDHGHEEEGGTPDETQDFTIAVPANLKGVAVSAAVGVPVLVNE